jgi:hypothetical protein
VEWTGRPPVTDDPKTPRGPNDECATNAISGHEDAAATKRTSESHVVVKTLGKRTTDCPSAPQMAPIDGGVNTCTVRGAYIILQEHSIVICSILEANHRCSFDCNDTVPRMGP